MCCYSILAWQQELSSIFTVRRYATARYML